MVHRRALCIILDLINVSTSLIQNREYESDRRRRKKRSCRNTSELLLSRLILKCSLGRLYRADRADEVLELLI